MAPGQARPGAAVEETSKPVQPPSTKAGRDEISDSGETLTPTIKCKRRMLLCVIFDLVQKCHERYADCTNKSGHSTPAPVLHVAWGQAFEDIIGAPLPPSHPG